MIKNIFITFFKFIDVLLFSEFINIVFVLLYIFIEFITLSHTFLVIYFAPYKEYIICIISFQKFPDVLPAFSYASVNGILWSIYVGLNIFNPVSGVAFIGNIQLLKALRGNSQPS